MPREHLLAEMGYTDRHCGLRDAGLIASRRQGGAVLHVLTPLGAELLQAG